MKRTSGAEASAGRRGERLAEKHLRRNGYTILARNYRCPAGEVDLIALAPDAKPAVTIAFVEVKTRSSERYVDPESAVNARKRRQLTGAARYYLAHHVAGDAAARFDVVAVVTSGGRPVVRHIADAFQ